jgi:hypothetical protein
MTDKKPKAKTPPKQRGTYDNKIEVRVGTTFMDLIGNVVKDAEKKEDKKD